jgi:hypothetical protein
MISDHATEDDFDHEAEALRSGLRTRADRVTITRPPIPAVRQSARKRRTRRGLFQGLSVVAVTCAAAAGAVAWSPGSGTSSSPTPPGTRPTPTHTTRAEPAPPPSSTPSTPPQTTSATDGRLLASDIGSQWTGPTLWGMRPSLDVAGGNLCSGYKTQVPVTPTPNHIYRPPSGNAGNVALEAIYTFSPGTGPAVMSAVRAALGTGCGDPKLIKLLMDTPTVADEAIVFTTGGSSRNALVRSGDRVASVVVGQVPDGQQGNEWFSTLVKQMAVRLVGG